MLARPGTRRAESTPGKPCGMDEELTIGPGTTLRVVAHSDDVLEIEASYAPNGAPPPAHLHPEQDERFEVLAGAVRVRAAEADGVIMAGEVLEIPRGTVHQMWNGRDE